MNRCDFFKGVVNLPGVLVTGRHRLARDTDTSDTRGTSSFCVGIPPDALYWDPAIRWDLYREIVPAMGLGIACHKKE
jgi:hypothetical protein